MVKIAIFKEPLRQNTMRQLLTSLIFISISLIGVSQVKDIQTKLTTGKSPPPHNKTDQRGSDFFCEDFSNGFEGNNPFGAWTFEDSGNNPFG
jgi:hypothetical protein